jgi:hypothetical protein
MRKRLLITLLIVLAIPTIAAVAMGSDQRALTADAVAATARFHDLDKATAAGYGEFRDAAGIACIESATAGGMGVHYVNGSLVGDTVLDPERPEALVYAPNSDRKLKLAALKYIVFAAPWDAEHAQRPELFGRQFDYTPSPNRYGIPAFYALHAWVWRPNTSGLLEPYNPRVDCS